MNLCAILDPGLVQRNIEMSKVITVLTTDLLTTKMFVDYYTKIHSGGKVPFMVKPSYYNSIDIVCSQISQAKTAVPEGSNLLVLYRVPDQFLVASTPKELLELSDLLFFIDPKRSGSAATVIKSDPQDLVSIVDRFSAGIERMGSM